MSVTLCMIVKNEFERVSRCIDSARAFVDEICITDTGSTDGTQDLLYERYGIVAGTIPFEVTEYLHRDRARNLNFEKVRTDWILSLDADEVVVGDFKSAIRSVQAKNKDGLCEGAFALWRNRLSGGNFFDDYKLFLLQKDVRCRGLIHENMQINIRERKRTACWVDEFSVVHEPDLSRLSEKKELYLRTLRHAIELDPKWFRYYWFLGYTHFLANELDSALETLVKCAYSDSDLFPVERLNSLMVIADAFARRRDRSSVLETLRYAEHLYQSRKDDFEVRINFRLYPWFARAFELASQDHLDKITAYEFGA